MQVYSLSSIGVSGCRKPAFCGIQKIGMPITDSLRELDNIHLDDKLSILLKNLSKDDYIVISSDRDGAIKHLKTLSALVGRFKGTIYHIKNDKFSEVLVFGKNRQSEGIDFVNLNDEPVRMNTIPVKSYFGVKVKDGDRVWGSNMRSVLIKSNPSVSDDLERKYALLADRYDMSELDSISSEVNYRPTTTNHVH